MTTTMDDYIEDLQGPTEEEPDYGQDLYKKWFKFGAKSGFLALRPWLETGKISVDIGELNNGSLVSHTQVWTNIVELAVYLNAVQNRNADTLYPQNAKLGLPSNEGFIYYGGGDMDQKVVSRVLKVHHWEQSEGVFDAAYFAWKAAHFEGRRSPTGAVIPDMSKPLSFNLIKLSRREMAEMNLRLQLALVGHAARHEDWYQWAKKK